MRSWFSQTDVSCRSARQRIELHPESRPSRLPWLDAARAAAIIFMIQGHTMDVLLAPQYRQGVAFEAWSLFRGLTAPTFLVLCGFSFSVATMRSWPSYLGLSKPLLRRFGRFLFLVLLGYAMHMPTRSLSGLGRLDHEGWQSWFQVDVLQCVGISLAFTQLLVLASRMPRRFAGIALGLSVCIVLLTPLTWAIDSNPYVPVAAGAYFTSATGSLFPLFPWSAYVFLGAATGILYAMRSPFTPLLPAAVAVGGVMLILAGLALDNMPVTLYAHIDFWRTSPNLFFIRLGCVALLVAIVALISNRMPLPRHILSSLSRKSLIIYLVHISILYGSNWNPGLRQWIGNTLSPGLTLLWVAALLLSMMALGLVSVRCKTSTAEFVERMRQSAILFAAGIRQGKAQAGTAKPMLEIYRSPVR